MAHYARIENGFVKNVIVVSDDVAPELPGTWVKTSYNTTAGAHIDGEPLRKNYAGIGFVYDEVLDAFYPPRPSNLHLLNEETCVWELKPEFQGLKYVHRVKDGAVPVGDLMDGEGLRVLFTTAPQPGVYILTDGVFEFSDEEQFPIKDLSSDVNEVYTFMNGSWTPSLVV